MIESEKDRPRPSPMNRPGPWLKWPFVWKRTSAVPRISNGSVQRRRLVSNSQTRPLLILGTGRPEPGRESRCPGLNQPILLEGGISASPGVACGPAFLVETTVDMLQFPAGAGSGHQNSFTPMGGAVESGRGRGDRSGGDYRSPGRRGPGIQGSGPDGHPRRPSRPSGGGT